MAKLSAASVASYYTAAQIAAKITEYQTLLDNAAQGPYRLDSGQNSQGVTPPDPSVIGQLLETYLKAYKIKTGQGFATLTHVDFRPTGGPL
ncbi:MAG: hypothetical protein IMZ69_04725 [Spirochaetes bacterium]|nr:hypothetical protein [Spirochaetota bacterium]